MHTKGPAMDYSVVESSFEPPSFVFYDSEDAIVFIIKDISESQARLIAAAPELLQRLEDARGAIDSLDDDALGWATGDMDIGVAPWPLKEELLHRIDEAIRIAKEK